MRKPLIAGNWKMNKTIRDGISLVKNIKNGMKDIAGVEIVVAPPCTALGPVAGEIEGSEIKLAAQDLFWEDSGAYTGEVSGEMVKDAGCAFVIIGHSERRQYFRETDETVNKKIRAALKYDLAPIVCVGETLEQKENGKTGEVIERQVKEGLKGLTSEKGKNIVMAYEPVWAIGTGKNATPQQANEVHTRIRELLANLLGEDVAAGTRILYGGSVKPSNSAELLSEKEIDGALVGGASLEADSFLNIARSACMV